MENFTPSHIGINSDEVSETNRFGNMTWTTMNEDQVVVRFDKQNTSKVYVFFETLNGLTTYCFISKLDRNCNYESISTSALYIMDTEDANNIISVVSSTRNSDMNFSNEFNSVNEAEELVEYIIELLDITHKKLSGKVLVLANAKPKSKELLPQCIEEIKRYRHTKVLKSKSPEEKNRWYEFWK
jgi:hypothetical protein